VVVGGEKWDYYRCKTLQSNTVQFFTMLNRLVAQSLKKWKQTIPQQEKRAALGACMISGLRHYATQESKKEAKQESKQVMSQQLSADVAPLAESPFGVDMWNPVTLLDDRQWNREFNRARRQLNRFFNVLDPLVSLQDVLDLDPMQELSRATKELQKFVPKIDVSETDDAILVHAELPGLKKDDVKIELKDGALEIKGEKKMETKEGDDKKFTRIERVYGSFYRRISVPREVEPNKVNAKFENGLLEIQIPKPEDKKARQVQIS